MSKSRILIIGMTAASWAPLLALLEQDERYEFTAVSDSGAARTKVGDSRPDLVIVTAPGSDAEEAQLIASLKRDLPAAPTLALTERPLAGLQDRFTLHLPPPVSADSLRLAIQDMLRLAAIGVTEQGALLNLLLQASEAVIAVDTEGRILLCNNTACRLFEIGDPESVRGRPVLDGIQNTSIHELFSKIPTPEHSQRSEVALQDGELVLSAQVTDIPGAGRLAIMQDITHFKKLDRIKSEFVQRVSRDIRSPLTTILGYVELLERIGSVTEQQHRFVERIIFSVQSISALLADLLELGRVEADFDTDRESVQLGMIIRYAVEGCRQQYEGKQQRLNIDLPEHTAPVQGNPIHLRQMINNLLDNAIKYTPANGTIKVTLMEQGEVLVLQISDTGIGIPVTDQPHVFERFYRASNVTSEQSTGLGLSIVKGIVDKHNGRIWLESQEGQGTTFTVVLPNQSGHLKAYKPG